MRNTLLGFLLGVTLGLWFGVNLCKNQPIYSNPFTERTIGDMLGDKSEQLGKALEDTGKRFKQKLAPKD